MKALSPWGAGSTGSEEFYTPYKARRCWNDWGQVPSVSGISDLNEGYWKRGLRAPGQLGGCDEDVEARAVPLERQEPRPKSSSGDLSSLGASR